MDFLNDLGKTIEHAARQIGEKSEEIWEAGKINIEIFKQQDAVRKLQKQIGEQVSAKYNEGQRFDTQINELCAEIQEKNKKIKELREKLKKTEQSTKKQPDENLTDEQLEQQILRTAECSPSGPGMTGDQPSDNVQPNGYE